MIPQKRTLASLLLTLTACGSTAAPVAPPPKPVASAPAPPSVSAAAPPQASAAPSSPSSSPAATAKPAVPVAANPPAFGLVADLPGSCFLYPVDGALVLVSSYAMMGEDLKPWIGTEELKHGGGGAAYSIGVLSNGNVLFSEPMALPIGAYGPMIGIAGRYPKDLRAITNGGRGRTGGLTLYAFKADRWQASEAEYMQGDLADLVHVGERAYLLVVGWENEGAALYDPLGKPVPYHFTPIRGEDYAPTDASKLSESWNDSANKPWQTLAVHPSCMGSTADGQLLSIGKTWKGEPAAEIWKAGGKTSTIEKLESDAPSCPIARGIEKDAWSLGGGTLMHYDGSRFSRVEKLPDELAHVKQALMTSDSALWARVTNPQDDTEAGELYRRMGEKWERIVLPGGVKVDDMAIYDGALYLSANGALLRYGLVSSGVPTKKVSRRLDVPKRLTKIGGAHCKSNLVVLYEFTKVTPDDYDFPLTRKALKGHTEFSGVHFMVSREGGRKFFTARVPSFEVGTKLRDLVAKEVEGAKPQVVCAEPEVVRELKIDLRTGDVVK